MKLQLITFIQTFFNFQYIYCDAPEAWQMGAQDPATPIMEGIIYFHNHLQFYLIIIGIFVLWMLVNVIYSFNEFQNNTSQIFTHSSVLEIIWTIIPAVILLFIAVPSFALLYAADEILNPALTLKINGHQWYWTYEYSNADESNPNSAIVKFDSYMIPSEDLTFGAFRLLETDNRVVLPTETAISLLISSADVLHSWAIPSFGVKVDACPGRLSYASIFIKRAGVFYGQCSEICGINHAFMPITIKSLDVTQFSKWIATKLENTNNESSFIAIK